MPCNECLNLNDYMALTWAANAHRINNTIEERILRLFDWSQIGIGYRAKFTGDCQFKSIYFGLYIDVTVNNETIFLFF